MGEGKKPPKKIGKQAHGSRPRHAHYVRRALHCRTVMKGEKLIREILRQADKQPHGRDRGWIAIQIRKVSERDLSLHIEEASHRGLLKATPVTNFDSPHDEWKVLDITATGLQFLQDTKLSKRIRVFLWAAVVVLIGFVGWLIPVVISLLKK